ncbi:hypothetical protein IAR50_007293 [Cryptococcus sp. DSM 104548]
MQGDSTAPHHLQPSGTGKTQTFRGPPLGVIQQRGTVSMPSSPLIGRYHTSTDVGQVGWRAPQTATIVDNLTLPPSASDSQSPYLFPNSASPYQLNIATTPVYNQNYSGPNNASSPQSTALLQRPKLHGTPSMLSNNTNLNYNHSIHNQPNYAFRLPSSVLSDVFSKMQQGELANGDEGIGESGKKKRAQVRVACTHCQKACKRCSNTRPCERCVKYGLNDCIDSTRKPRKTGIKRGPYKRRASKIVAGDQRVGASCVPQHPHLQGLLQPQGNVPAAINTFEAAPSLSLQPQRSISAYPPGPRPTTNSSALTDALSAALTGPRWVNGQRVSVSSSSGPQNIPTMQVSANVEGGPNMGLHTTTERDTFPLALGTTDDPFSRAVSPIGHFSLSKFKRHKQAQQSGGPEADLNVGAHDQVQSPSRSRATSARPSLSVDTTTGSRPTSAHADSPGLPGNMSPYYVPAKIRKPSLWTLMSASSAPGSPVPLYPHPPQYQKLELAPRINPEKQTDSPTLFNSPMGMENLDLGTGGPEFDGWNGFGSQSNKEGLDVGRHEDTAVVPRRQSGQVTDGGDSARVMEGMGMMGFEGLMGFS